MPMPRKDAWEIRLENFMTPEIELAYELHGKVYEGKSLTEAEQAFYDKCVGALYLQLTSEDKSVSEEVPFGVRIWLIYATKYVSHDWKLENLPHWSNDGDD
jgi:hypothetical protein